MRHKEQKRGLRHKERKRSLSYKEHRKEICASRCPLVFTTGALKAVSHFDSCSSFMHAQSQTKHVMKMASAEQIMTHVRVSKELSLNMHEYNYMLLKPVSLCDV